MAKSKTNTAEVTKQAENITLEDAELLQSRKKSNVSQETSEEVKDYIPGISINNTKGIFTGGGSKEYGASLKIRPIDYFIKFKRSSTAKKDNYKVLAETVLVRPGTKTPFIDTDGTLMCGRLPQWKVPNTWTEAQKETNFKHASLYGVLYGVLDSGDLVRVQLPSAKSGITQKYIESLNVDDTASVIIELKLNEGLIELSTIQEGLDVAPLLTQIKKVNEDVKRYNDYVESKHKAISSQTSVTNAVVYDQSPNTEVDLDDGVPF